MSSDPEFERIAEAIDAHLAYLHKERWAQRAAELREEERRAEGEAKARARQALFDHYDDMHRPETSRDALLEQARLNHAARKGNRAWTERVPETMRRLSADPELLRSIERRGF